MFFTHLSRRLNWAFLSFRWRRKLLTFLFSNLEPLCKNLQNLAQSNYGKKGYKIVLIKDTALFQKKDDSDIATFLWRIFKIFFRRTNRSISAELGLKHHWVWKSKVYSVKGHALINGRCSKITLRTFKNLLLYS